MTEEQFTHQSRISPKIYIEDYIKNYGRHRTIVVSRLLYDWQKNNLSQKAIIGSRVLMEFGASIEELFAFTYSIYKQCNVAHDVPPEEKEVFFKHLFEYKHHDLFNFIKNNEFINWIESHFNLPECKNMAKHMSYTKQEYTRSLAEAEHCLEWKKVDFFERDFKAVYNKLKHPFLVLAPIEQDKTRKLILPVLVKTKKEDLIAEVVPIGVDFSDLEIFQSDILIISQTIEFLLKLLLKRPV